jgi:hypothetical protein
MSSDAEADFAVEVLTRYLGWPPWKVWRMMDKVGTRSQVQATNRLPQANTLKPEDRRELILAIWPLEKFETEDARDEAEAAAKTKGEPYQGDGRDRGVDTDTGEIVDPDVFGSLGR